MQHIIQDQTGPHTVELTPAELNAEASAGNREARLEVLESVARGKGWALAV